MKEAHPIGSWKLAAMLLAGSVASPAGAGWQSTNWNMTPEEVASAMAGQAPISRGKRGDRLHGKRVGNVGEYQLEKARFRSVYYYDAKGLAHVALSRTSGDCTEIYNSVASRHGAPLRISNQVILKLFIWHDRTAGNRIRLLVSKDICDLNYERLSDYGARDLAAA